MEANVEPAFHEYIPVSRRQCERIVNPLSLPSYEHDACPDKDCVVFFPGNDLQDATECPVCGAERYDALGKSRRTVTYFSIKEHIKRLMEVPVVAEMLRKASRQRAGSPRSSRACGARPRRVASHVSGHESQRSSRTLRHRVSCHPSRGLSSPPAYRSRDQWPLGSAQAARLRRSSKR